MDYFGHMASVAKVASESDRSIVLNRNVVSKGATVSKRTIVICV